MNIKEAMDDLYICATGAKYNTPTLGVGYYEKCWETVLNELDKKDKVIDLIVNTIVGDRKILKLVCNKIINKKEDECFEQNKLCDDCIKEYFYNKIDIDKK